MVKIRMRVLTISIHVTISKHVSLDDFTVTFVDGNNRVWD